MLKLLKASVVVMFALSVAALVLGIMLFNRRQILLGRTLTLERGITMLAATLETRFPSPEDGVIGVPRDIDAVDAERVEFPRTATVWESYNPQLEVAALDTMDLKSRSRELQSFFLMDPVTSKPVRDPITNQRIIDGPGTMRGVLDEVVASAEQQLNRLHETRHQLVALRKECTDVTVELNRRKQELRTALCEVVDRDGQIVALQRSVAERDMAIAEKDDQLSDLNTRLVQSEHVTELQVEELGRLSNSVAFWRKRYEDFRGEAGDVQPDTWLTMSRGLKGRVVSVDADHDFVILELNPDFVNEYSRAMSHDNTIPPPAMIVTRKQGGQEDFIAKVELGTVDVSQKLGVGAVLASWKQGDILVNDCVVY